MAIIYKGKGTVLGGIDGIDGRLLAVDRYNSDARFRADGGIRVQVWNCTEIDGEFKLRESYFDVPPHLPTATRDVFGEEIHRQETGLSRSRWAPKKGSRDEKKAWIMSDLIYHYKEAATINNFHQKRKLYQEHAREMLKYLKDAHCGIHPFEIYRNLVRLYNISFFPKEWLPLQGEPGYLPPDLVALCEEEANRLGAAYLESDHTLPDYRNAPIHALKFENLPDFVPGGVYLSVNPGPSEPAPAPGTCRITLTSGLGFTGVQGGRTKEEAEILTKWAHKALGMPVYIEVVDPSKNPWDFSTSSSAAKSATDASPAQSTESDSTKATPSPSTKSVSPSTKSAVAPSSPKSPITSKPNLATNYDDWFAKMKSTSKQATSILKNVSSKLVSTTQANPITPAKTVTTFDGYRSDETIKANLNLEPKVNGKVIRRLATPDEFDEFLSAIVPQYNKGKAPIKNEEAPKPKPTIPEVKETLPREPARNSSAVPAKTGSNFVHADIASPSPEKPAVSKDVVKANGVSRKPEQASASKDFVKANGVSRKTEQASANKDFVKAIGVSRKPEQASANKDFVKADDFFRKPEKPSATKITPASPDSAARLATTDQFIARMARANAALESVTKEKLVPQEQSMTQEKPVTQAPTTNLVLLNGYAVARNPEIMSQKTKHPESRKDPTLQSISKTSINVHVESPHRAALPVTNGQKKKPKLAANFDAWFSQAKPLEKKYSSSHPTKSQQNGSTVAASVANSVSVVDADNMAVPGMGKKHIASWAEEVSKLPIPKVNAKDPMFNDDKARPIEYGQFQKPIRSTASSSDSESEKQTETWLANVKLAFEAANRKDRHLALQRTYEEKQKQPVQIEEHIHQMVNEKSPRIDVHFRPAEEADMEGLAEVYNNHIEHGICDQALEKATAEDMLDLFDSCREEQLPMIVAVTSNSSDTNTNSKDQRVVGFVYARNLSSRGPGSLAKPSASKSRFRANLSIYVHGDYRRNHIGSCLMDRIHKSMSSTYFPYEDGTYEYITSPEVDNIYLDAWDSTPTEFRNFSIDLQSHSSASEDDKQLAWMKNWLKAWGYEQQGRVLNTGRSDWMNHHTGLDTVVMLRQNDVLSTNF